MNTQPEALRLADKLNYQVDFGSYDWKRVEPMMAKAAAELRRLHAENEALRADAERYRWLRDNNNTWSWGPSKYNDVVVSGFAANGTGYLGYSFAAAIDAARSEK